MKPKYRIFNWRLLPLTAEALQKAQVECACLKAENQQLYNHAKQDRQQNGEMLEARGSRKAAQLIRRQHIDRPPDLDDELARFARRVKHAQQKAEQAEQARKAAEQRAREKAVRMRKIVERRAQHRAYAKEHYQLNKISRAQLDKLALVDLPDLARLDGIEWCPELVGINPVDEEEMTGIDTEEA